MRSYIKAISCCLVLALNPVLGFSETEPSPLQQLFQNYLEDTSNLLKKKDNISLRPQFYKTWRDRFEEKLSTAKTDDPGVLQILSELTAIKYSLNDPAGAVESARYIVQKFPDTAVANYQKVNLAQMLFYSNSKDLTEKPEILLAFKEAVDSAEKSPDILLKIDFYQKYILLLNANKDPKAATEISMVLVKDIGEAIEKRPAQATSLDPYLEWAYAKLVDLYVQDKKIKEALSILDLLVALPQLSQDKYIYIQDASEGIKSQGLNKEYRACLTQFLNTLPAQEKRKANIKIAESYQRDEDFENAAKFYSLALDGIDFSDKGLKAENLDSAVLTSGLPNLAVCLRRMGMFSEADEISNKLVILTKNTKERK